MSRYRVSLFTVGVWIVKASRASVLVLLGSLLVQYARSEELYSPTRFVSVLGFLIAAAYGVDLILKWHVGKERTTVGGWKFWMYVCDTWFLVTRNQCSTMSLRGRRRRAVEYFNDLIGIFVYGFSRIGKRELELVGTECSEYLPLFHRNRERTRLGHKILASRHMQPLTGLEMWNTNGQYLRLRVVGENGSYKASDECSCGTVRYFVTVRDVSRVPLIYDPGREKQHLSTDFASTSDESSV